MPKQKSHRGAAKRFSFTKTGIVKHKQMNANHQVRLKTTKRTRHLRADGIVDNAAEAKTIHTLLAFGLVAGALLTEDTHNGTY